MERRQIWGGKLEWKGEDMDSVRIICEVGVDEMPVRWRRGVCDGVLRWKGCAQTMKCDKENMRTICILALRGNVEM